MNCHLEWNEAVEVKVEKEMEVEMVGEVVIK